ncbi:MAG: ADP-ribosylation factor-like protein [Aquificaceae bacterium]|nr:ADP-ribosylation factor-like protein [Aquificaceae bacterium]
MNVHILYHGLGMAGKTTNLEKLKEIYPGYVSDRVHQKTKEDRTVYIDMLALNIKTRSGDKEVNISLFTTPGQERFRLLRSWLFGQVNGMVFVFDSTRSIEENMRAYEELKQYRLSKVPTVIQANKRDVKGALPLTVIQQAFNGYTVVEAVASAGIGVAETFRLILKEVLNATASAR